MRMNDFHRKTIFPAFLLFFASLASAQKMAMQNKFFQVGVSPNGNYRIEASQYGWQFRGSLGVPATHIHGTNGVDNIGSYHELIFAYSSSGARQGSIRMYDRHPILQFDMTMLRAGKNQGAFPDFSSGPADLHRLGFQPTSFAEYKFNYLGPQGPWALFDDQSHTLLISPADHFYVTDMESQSAGLSSGITHQVAELPSGFSHKTLFVLGSGINSTFEAWGQAMQKAAGRKPPANDAGVLLRKLSYWTDHGSAYFYNFEPQMGYTGTLVAVKEKFIQLGVPLGSMQIDSWFYPKGKTADWHRRKWTNGVGGEYLYEADRDVFPNGLKAFSRAVDLPLITHGRWVDQWSPYRREYKMSGNVIIDPGYWLKTAAWLHAANVVTYEQDWLSRYAKTAINLTDPEQFHHSMADAMRRYGLTMQYCMALPADFMQGARYENLTTIRTSHDRFYRKDWDMFLYDSRLASALGIWPWTDVFRSGEQANLVMATLSAGPVGVGDSLQEIDPQDLLHAVRADGVIVKPDVTIRPLDRMYLSDARNVPSPMVASTWTEFGKTRIAYVFAYARNNEKSASLQLSETGFTGQVYAYDWRTGLGKLLAAPASYRIPFQDGWGYAVISPVGPSGMAFLGDTKQFVTAGRSRIAEFSDNGVLRVTVRFAKNEKDKTIALYSPREPQATALAGKITKQSYDDADHLLSLTIAANSAHVARLRISPSK